MGKSHNLHCEVQLLDDQSTTVDLDVSVFCLVKFQNDAKVFNELLSSAKFFV